MIQKIKKLLMVIVGLLLSTTAFSHDFEVGGIYYNYLDETAKTVMVTYRGSYSTNYFNEYTGAVTIPSSVTYSGITYSVTSIGSEAFHGCDGLTSVTIGNSVTSIGSSAFWGCDGLTSVTIPNSVTSIGSCVFWGCDGLTSVTIPNSVTSIGSYAFEGWTGLTSITIPNSVTEIGFGAFRGCDGLTSVTIGNSVTSIGSEAFRECSGLTSIVVEEGNPKYDSRDNCNAIVETSTNTLILGCKNSTIPNSVTSIGNDAFGNCSGLTSITIPNSVTSIGYGAFSGCTGLTSVNYNAENCTSMGSSNYPVFGGCSNLKIVNIGSSVKSIPSYAFYGCTGLTEVTISNSVTSIGSGAFEGCTGLTSVNYNAENCTSMGSSSYPVFSGCSNLKTLNVGNEVKTIPSYAFCNCDGLTSITIPNSVTAIGNDAFYGCSNLIESNNVISPTSVKVNLNTLCSSNLVPCIAINNKYYTNNTLVESLDPEYNYNYDLGLKFKDNFIHIGSSSFSTNELYLTTQDAKATSLSSVRLIATTNCDATTSTGFEWRRYDAPAEMPSNKVSCPIVDGMLVGTLRGLRDDAYYKYRPFYTSASGKTYYGEWIAFFTGDANVYFEPEVQTYSDYAITDNSVVVKGYALEGTDEITAQGFEYWKTGSTILPSSTENRMTVMASGIKMSATLANLEYNSTYKYRAFVTTAKGTTYGDEVEFETGNDPVGVENILIDKSATEVFEIARYDIHGRLLSKPSRGINIIIYSDGSTRKEIVKE